MMGYDRFGSGFGNMMNDGWGGVLLLVFGALLIAGVVLLAVWAMRASSRGRSASGGPTPPQALGHDEAVAVARKRLASGEITREEFDQIMGVLGG
jgi:uncharacterized membrane protein